MSHQSAATHSNNTHVHTHKQTNTHTQTDRHRHTQKNSKTAMKETIQQEAQLTLTTGAMRLAVSRGQQTWYHFGSVATFR